jgi:hypothetical protein
VFSDFPSTSAHEASTATKGDVQIGNDVWIGSNVTILSGVTVFDGAVIGANSTVSRDVGPHEVWAGNPARLIRRRFEGEIIEKLLELQWWNLGKEDVGELFPFLSSSPKLADLTKVIDKYKNRPRLKNSLE